MIETSLDPPWESSETFGNLRKFLDTFMWPSHNFCRIFGKWSEIFGESSKTLLSVFLYNKKKRIHGCLWIWNISSRVQLYISLIRCAHSWDIELNNQRLFHTNVCQCIILFTAHQILYTLVRWIHKGLFAAVQTNWSLPVVSVGSVKKGFQTAVCIWHSMMLILLFFGGALTAIVKIPA